jgi:hypothetical protein
MNIFDNDGSHPLDNADWDDEPVETHIETDAEFGARVTALNNPPLPDVEITPVVEHINTFSTNENNVHVQAAQVGADFTVTYQDGGYWDDIAGSFIVPRYDIGEYKGEPKVRYIINDETSEVVGNHSGRYPVRDGYTHNFEVLEQAFPNSCVSVDMFDGGKRVLVTQDLSERVQLPMGDEVARYVYSVASLDGTKRSYSVPKALRISCENQLGLHLAIFSAKATRNHDQNLWLQAEVFAQGDRQMEELLTMAGSFTSQSITDFEFERLVKSILPRPLESDSTKAKNKWEKTRVAIDANWKKEASLYGDKNLWVAYNAVQGAEQHKVNMEFRTKSDKGYERGREKSFMRSMEGKTPIADACEAYLRELVLA